MRCSMAEAIAAWVREDVAAAVQDLGARLASIDNYASYDCRGRNNIAGAKLSEHGKANALDIRSVKLADGKVHQARPTRTSPTRVPRGDPAAAPARASARCSARARTAITRITSTWTCRSAGPAASACANGTCAIRERRAPKPPTRKVPLPPRGPKIEPASAQSRPKL